MLCIGWSTLGGVSVNEAPPWDASPCIKHKAYDKNIFMNLCKICDKDWWFKFNDATID
jgi:hypothetical protein